jgi:hypothetical protein
MIGKRAYETRAEVLQETLDMLILKTLHWGPQHGYGIVQALRANSGELLRIETGSLYPALHRLERQGWVRSDWKQTESPNRPPRHRGRGRYFVVFILPRFQAPSFPSAPISVVDSL